MAGIRKDKDPGETRERETLPAEEFDSCGLCSALFSQREEKSPCGGSKKPSAGSWRFMTEREFSVLKAMRSLREKAVSIRKRIRALERSLQESRGPKREAPPAPASTDTAEDLLWEQQMAEELLYHCDRLAVLKQQWKEMDVERMAAQEERMRLLGHIQ